MSRVILCLGFFLFAVGCSSSNKQDNTAAATTAATAAPKAQPSPTATPAAKTETAGLTCEKDKEKRTLDIVKADGGCELRYVKGDNVTVPATSKNGATHCETVQAKIQKNLEAAGYKCQ